MGVLWCEDIFGMNVLLGIFGESEMIFYAKNDPKWVLFLVD